jgi:hypothetical protein
MYMTDVTFALHLLEVQSMGQYQEVLAWGWLAWSSSTDSGVTPQYCEAIGELGVVQIVCAERCVLILTSAGKVFSVYYSSETQVRLIGIITQESVSQLQKCMKSLCT